MRGVGLPTKRTDSREALLAWNALGKELFGSDDDALITMCSEFDAKLDGPPLSDTMRLSIACQMAVDYFTLLSRFVTSCAPVLKKIASVTAQTTDLGDDPKRPAAWLLGVSTPLQPSSVDIFDASQFMREMRGAFRDMLASKMDALLPVSRGNAPALRTSERLFLERDVRNEYKRRCVDEIANAGKKRSDTTIRGEMADARRYGLPPRWMTADQLEHILRDSDNTDPIVGASLDKVLAVRPASELSPE